VDHVLLAGKQSALEAVVALGRLLPLDQQLLRQRLNDRIRHSIANARIDESKKHQMTEKNFPVRTETLQESSPIEVVAFGQNQMSNVGAVIALALHDEGFRPDHFLHGANLSRSAENLSGIGVSEPVVIDRGYAVAGAENDIDEVVSLVNLGEPM